MESPAPPATPAAYQEHSSGVPREKKAEQDVLSPDAIRVDADTKGHVFPSPDRGATWEDISDSGPTALPNLPHLDIVADPDVPNILYVANDIGLFRTTNANAGAATIWSPFGMGLPRIVVHSLTLRRASRILAARTSGRGPWVIQLTDIPIPGGPSSPLFALPPWTLAHRI